MTTMMHPPTTGQTLTALGGRVYVGVAGTPQAMNDADAAIAGANGWTTAAKGGSGTTALRPPGLTNADRGLTYTDTTVGGNILWDGATWRNPATGASV